MSNRRIPTQERGERRVTELLEAAAAILAEVGYEATTLTAVAERAGASIGALYQYFPNKEAIVRALLVAYGNELDALWAPLLEEAATLSVKQLVARIFSLMVDFIESRPAYLRLIDAPSTYRRDPAARARLREHFAAVFRQKRPDLDTKEAIRIANVTLQVIKSMNPLYGTATARERAALAEEFELVVSAYLTARLRA